MDLGWSPQPEISFRLFQGKVLEEYDRLVSEYGLDVIDATGSITDQQRVVRERLANHLNGESFNGEAAEPLHDATI